MKWNLYISSGQSVILYLYTRVSRGGCNESSLPVVDSGNNISDEWPNEIRGQRAEEDAGIGHIDQWHLVKKNKTKQQIPFHKVHPAKPPVSIYSSVPKTLIRMGSLFPCHIHYRLILKWMKSLLNKAHHHDNVCV